MVPPIDVLLLLFEMVLTNVVAVEYWLAVLRDGVMVIVEFRLFNAVLGCRSVAASLILSPATVVASQRSWTK